MKYKIIFLICTLIPSISIAQSVIKNVFLEEEVVKIIYEDTLKQYTYESLYTTYKEDSYVYFNMNRQKVYIKPSIILLDSVIENYIEKNSTPDSVSYGTYATISICFVIDNNGYIMYRGLVRGSTEDSFEKKIKHTIYKCDLKFPIFYDKKGEPAAYFYYYYFGVP